MPNCPTCGRAEYPYSGKKVALISLDHFTPAYLEKKYPSLASCSWQVILDCLEAEDFDFISIDVESVFFEKGIYFLKDARILLEKRLSGEISCVHSKKTP